MFHVFFLNFQKTNDVSAELWHDEIQACIDHSNKHSDETIQLAQGLVAINQSIDKGDPGSFINTLNDPGVGIKGALPECADEYLKALRQAKQEKANAGMIAIVMVLMVPLLPLLP